MNEIDTAIEKLRCNFIAYGTRAISEATLRGIIYQIANDLRTGKSNSSVGQKEAQSLNERATAVLRDRLEAHGQDMGKPASQERLHRDFKTIGGVWRSLLIHAWGIDVPVIPAALAAQLLAGLKLWRMGVMQNEHFVDSAVDGINYIEIADQCRKWEEKLRAEKTIDGRDSPSDSSVSQTTKAKPDYTKS